jgi:hypothetical protein
VPDHDSAFSHRDALARPGRGPGPDRRRRRCSAALDRYASGAYVNFVNDDGPEAVLRAYSAPKLARLTAVKTAYDPDDIFRLNHDIKPASR